MNGIDAVNAKVEQPPKATILMSEINRMENIVDRLCHLRDRIQSGSIPMGAETSVQDTISPTIANVLTEGAEALQVKNNKMVDLLDQIDKELF